METANNTAITVAATINAPIAKVWAYWGQPEHIMQWCQASPDWHAPYADNNLHTGGTFKTTMAAKDGSFSFDFGGVYSDVQENKRIAYDLEDGRKVEILFEDLGNTTQITETFDPESQNPIEMQRGGWQAILDSFKKYTEENYFCKAIL